MDLKNKKNAIIIGLSVVAVAGTIGLAGYGIGRLKKNNNNDSGSSLFNNSSSYTISSTKVTEGNISEINDVSEVAELVMPSVVSITETSVQQGYFFGQLYSNEVSGSGSGIIIGENDNELLIVTNNHVVEGADTLEVQFCDDKSCAATVKGTEPDNDLAVILVNKSDMEQSTLDSIKIASLGDSDELRVGDAVVAIGNALGYGQSVTFGYVSAKEREIEVDNSTGGITKLEVLQTDAAINPGNSGGALVNLKGEVIGINSAKLASEEVEGMGYAIPITSVRDIIDDLSLKELLADSDKGFLGITGTDISDEQSEMLGYPAGVYVSEVLEGGGAEKAGIKKGDIITKINGKKVTSISQLASEVSSIKKGSTVTITLKRAYDGKYKEKKIEVELTERFTTDNEDNKEPEKEEKPEDNKNNFDFD
ncbi:MAG: trypsin-like peptidase domain-containing protein [Lachnospiraceae bacterium]|nr:trypsin-like peptidase domain-containing protein [Lachnospiraceae bacterium]